MNLSHLVIAICLVTVSVTARASCLDQRLTGVNLAGAEFGSVLPGTVFKDYVYPNSSELTYIANKGANIIRLPFRWERLQPQAKGPLNPAELQLIQSTVTSAKAKGLCVLLDVHNYAKYYSVSLAANTELQDAFVDLWLRLALAFKDPQATIFGLMNEPISMPTEDWAALSKRTLAELRKAQSSNWVFVAGGLWSGAHDWFSGSVSSASLFANLNDPLQRTALEVHQYVDQDFSGTHLDCRPASDFSPIFSKLNAWAKAHNQQFFLGEFGTPATQDCLNTLAGMLPLLDPSAWKGWSYWAAGGWWGKYPLALSTKPDIASPQWPILQSYFYNNNQASSSQAAPANPQPPILN